jgi:hypothetical protein
MAEEYKEPKDLGVKIGTKAEAFWQDTLRRLDVSILQYEESLIGEKVMRELANKRIAEEKEKFKK